MNIHGLYEISKLFMAYFGDHFFRWFPRKKDKWVFGAQGGFRDNPKYLFFWTIENHPEIRAIWIGKNKNDISFLREKGYEAYYWLSMSGLFHALTSKVYVCDHQLGNINQYLTGGAFYVNLWHGSSVKRVRWQAPDFFVRKYHLKNESEMQTSFLFKLKEYHVLFRTPDVCLVPSTKQAKDFFSPMMNISLDKCVVGVYPRSRLMIEGKEEALSFIKKYDNHDTELFVKEISSYSKVYIYMPTWRNDGNDFITQASIDWKKLNEVLEKKNELLILKFHPFTKMEMEDLYKYKNIYQYPPLADIYAVLPFVDCLITDYSSIYTDFLSMDKEIILFVFDYEQYIKGSYDLFDYDKYFVGKRAYNFDQLLRIIEKGEDCHIPSSQRNYLMDFFWDNNRHNIDLVEEIKQRIKI